MVSMEEIRKREGMKGKGGTEVQKAGALCKGRKREQK